jgi:hypothetical protein
MKPPTVCGISMRKLLIVALWILLGLSVLSFTMSFASTIQLTANTFQALICLYGIYSIYSSHVFLVMIFLISYGLIVVISIGIALVFIQSSQFIEVVDWISRTPVTKETLQRFQNYYYLGFVVGFLYQMLVWQFIHVYYKRIKNLVKEQDVENRVEQ